MLAVVTALVGGPVVTSGFLASQFREGASCLELGRLTTLCHGGVVSG